MKKGEKLFEVKPLEWRDHQMEEPWHEAATVFGSIHVRHYDGKWHWRYCFDEYYDEDQFECDDLDDGKQKAEEFYLSRILPALREIPQKKRKK